MSTPVIIGTLVTYGLSALLNQLGIYRWFFFVSAILSTVTALLWFFSFPRLNEAKDFEKPHRRLPNDVRLEEKKIPLALLAFLVVIGLTTAGNSLIKDGLVAWVPKILKDEYGTSDSISIILTLVLPICGLFGTMLLIWLAKRIPNNLLLCGTMAFSMSVLVFGFFFMQKRKAGAKLYTSP